MYFHPGFHHDNAFYILHLIKHLFFYMHMYVFSIDKALIPKYVYNN